MPQQLMLDPSLLLSRRSFDLITQGWQREELDGVTLPRSFSAAAVRGELSERSVNFFGSYARPVDPRRPTWRRQSPRSSRAQCHT